MTPAGHAVGNDGGKQGFDGSEQRERNCIREDRSDPVEG